MLRLNKQSLNSRRRFLYTLPLFLKRTTTSQRGVLTPVEFKDPADAVADKANTTDADLPSPATTSVPRHTQQYASNPVTQEPANLTLHTPSASQAEGGYHDSRQMPDNLKLKLFKTSSGWSTSPESQDTEIGGPVQAAQPGIQSPYEQGPQFTPPPPGTSHSASTTQRRPQRRAWRRLVSS